MKIDIITIFPKMFANFLDISMIKRAREKDIVTVNPINLRDFAHDLHQSVDDRPYGGGAGMVMKPQPLFEAVESLSVDEAKIVLLSPQGKTFDQSKARELSKRKHLILLCGHYEGVDDRVRTNLADEEISIGDYVLTNGNLAAMVLIDAVVRLLPGVLGCTDSIVEESFSDNLLEYPQYTRPAVFRDMKVPKMLLTGNHGEIKKWRYEQSLLRTKENRPDLLS